MSRLLIIVSILATIVTLGIISNIFFANTVNEMDTVLSKLLVDTLDENSEAVLENAKRLSTIWESRKSVLGLFVNRSELENIRFMIDDLSSLGKTKSFDSAYAQGCRVKSSLMHLYEMEIPTAQNLF